MAAAKMTSSALIAAVLLCLCLCAAEAKVDADLVAKACANATGDLTLAHRFKGPGLTRESCESALQSDKRSAVATHPRDLALIAMDLLLSATAAADAKVDIVLRSGKWDKVTVLELQYCRVDYGTLLQRTVPVCRAIVQEYNPSTANDSRGQDQDNDLDNLLVSDHYFACVDRLRNAAADCWQQLYFADFVDTRAKAKKAVWKEVVEAASRAILAKAMVEQMLGEVDF
ncbi:hypothetical protein BS78_01G304700 [Paspalum vaginatum]|nr:hypothetical protein BS78_01G304700 [Paspalum vaginatum]